MSPCRVGGQFHWLPELLENPVNRAKIIITVNHFHVVFMCRV